MLENILIGYAIVNVAITGLASAVMAGSDDSKTRKFITWLLILLFGLAAVVIYFMLPQKQVNRLNGSIMRRRASRSQKIVSKLKSIK